MKKQNCSKTLIRWPFLYFTLWWGGAHCQRACIHVLPCPKDFSSPVALDVQRVQRAVKDDDNGRKPAMATVNDKKRLATGGVNKWNQN